MDMMIDYSGKGFRLWGGSVRDKWLDALCSTRGEGSGNGNCREEDELQHGMFSARNGMDWSRMDLVGRCCFVPICLEQITLKTNRTDDVSTQMITMPFADGDAIWWPMYIVRSVQNESNDNPSNRFDERTCFIHSKILLQNITELLVTF